MLCLMSLRKKQSSTTKSRIKHSEDGLKIKKSNIKSQTEDIEDTSFQTTKKKKKLSIVESPPKNKKKIYKDKSNICKKNTQNTNSSQTPEAESISNEKIFSPFYNKSSKDKFQQLWLPPVIDLQDADTTSLNGCFCNSDADSFHYKKKLIDHLNKNCLKTCFQSLQSLQPDIMDQEDTVIRARKIKFYPTTEQKLFFNKCFGATRYIYNKLISAFKKHTEKQRKKIKKMAKRGCVAIIKTKAKSGSKTSKVRTNRCGKKLEKGYLCCKHQKSKVNYDINLNFQHWRNKLIKANTKLSKKEKWMKEIPYDTRQLVIKNALGGIKSALTNLKNGHIKHFDMQFKSKKNAKKYFFVDHRALKSDMSLWKAKTKEPLQFRKKEKEWIIDLMESGAKMKNMEITKDKSGSYYLQIPYNHKVVKNGKKKKIVSLDPGVITFQTFYSPNGDCGKIGDKFSDSLDYLNNKIKKLQSKISKLFDKKKEDKKNGKKVKPLRHYIRKLKQKLSKLRVHTKNKVQDLHCKTAKYLCEHYDNIIIPKFGTKQISKKLRENHMKKRANDTITLSHCEFLERLKTKAKMYKNCKVFVVDEYNTSKTCGNCGVLNKIGRSRVYNCNYCDYIGDRDINASRNIFIKAISNT